MTDLDPDILDLKGMEKTAENRVIFNGEHRVPSPVDTGREIVSPDNTWGHDPGLDIEAILNEVKGWLGVVA